MAYAIQNRAVAEKIKRDLRALVNLGHVHQSTKWTHLGNLGAIPTSHSGVAERLKGGGFEAAIKAAVLQAYRALWMADAGKFNQTGTTLSQGTYRQGPSDDYAANGTYQKGQAVVVDSQGSTWYRLTNGKYIKKSAVGSAFDGVIFKAVFDANLAPAIGEALANVSAVPPNVTNLLASVRSILAKKMLADARIKAMGIGA